MMKFLCVVLVSTFAASSALARDVLVSGYTRSNGTYVAPHHRTSPDNTVNNNYGTTGNSNPYTGSTGTQPRDTSQPQGVYNYGNGTGY